MRLGQFSARGLGLLIALWAYSRGDDESSSLLVPALIVFGDSTVDVGNNNCLNTIFKANFFPYGKDYETGEASGRFSNGCLSVDYLALRLRLPSPPAFLAPSANANGRGILQGINFASGGSGLLDSTANCLEIASFSRQIEWFRQYQNMLAQIVGAHEARSILSNALYLVSSGTNDFVLNYYLNPVATSNCTEFRDILVATVAHYIQELYYLGARRFAIPSLPPLGCLPWQRFFFKNGPGCNIEQNEQAMAYNTQLQSEIASLGSALTDLRIAYTDVYSIMSAIIEDPPAYGFVTGEIGCCGRDLEPGLVADAVLCGAPTTCNNASEYVFFDNFHPTQAVYQVIGDAIFANVVQQLGLSS